MKILFAATSYPLNAQDWRGRFVFDMASALAGRGDVALHLWSPPGELPSGVVSALAEGESESLGRLALAGGIAHLLRQSPLRGMTQGIKMLRDLRCACQRVCPDVYHCNWLQTALALPQDGKPALVTVLGTDFRLLRLPGMVWALRRALRGRAAMLAPNATWMLPRLQELFGDLVEVREIPFGVDVAWFDVQRNAVNSRDWITVVRLTRDKLGDLLMWGAGLFGGSSGRRLHLFGPMQEEIDLPDWLVWHGATNPRDLRENWFPRAAGMITLSRHAEGRPQVILEAMAAGLPVVASDIPAHVDLLRDGETGCLCSTPENFAAALRKLEGREENLRIGGTARAWLRDEIGDWQACAGRYAAAYQRLLTKGGACGFC